MSGNTIVKLARWRARDLAACFSACKMPRIDDEEPNCSSSTADHAHRKTLVFDPIGEDRRRQRNGPKMKRKKSHGDKASSSQGIADRKKGDDECRDESSRSGFKEEEYIVFCFKNDGTIIHMVKEKRRSEASGAAATCGESGEKTSGSSFVDMEDLDDEEPIAEKEACSSHPSGQAEGESGDTTEIDPSPIENDEAQTLSSMLSEAESSDSNHSESDGSSGSFAFPVLRWEWMGSPVHMPQPEDIGLRLRTQKARGTCLHCCRF